MENSSANTMIDASQQRIAHLEKRVGAQTKSPLFAQLANLYLEAQRAQDALRVCDAGLANFPFYTTGHLIKGKTLLALNMRAEARREFEFVLDFLPNNEAVINLLSQIPPSEEESIGSVSPTVTEELVTPEQPPPVYEAPSPLAPEPSYGFKTTETPASETSPLAGVTAGTTFFDGVIQAPPVSTSEDIFGLGTSKPSVEVPVTPEPSTFDGFNFPQQETPTFPEPSPPSIEPTGGFDLSTSTVEPSITALVPIEEEPFDQFAQRKRDELTGENTISLDDYINNRVPTQPAVLTPVPPVSAGVQSKIEELAQKLQSTSRITPVINFAQKETSTVSEQDTPAGMGFVTPTLAEIYAKQGWYDDAIKAYKTLARNKPAESERFEKRITELEELKKQQAGS